MMAGHIAVHQRQLHRVPWLRLVDQAEHVVLRDPRAGRFGGDDVERIAERGGAQLVLHADAAPDILDGRHQRRGIRIDHIVLPTQIQQRATGKVRLDAVVGRPVIAGVIALARRIQHLAGDAAQVHAGVGDGVADARVAHRGAIAEVAVAADDGGERRKAGHADERVERQRHHGRVLAPELEVAGAGRAERDVGFTIEQAAVALQGGAAGGARVQPHGAFQQEAQGVAATQVFGAGQAEARGRAHAAVELDRMVAAIAVGHGGVGHAEQAYAGQVGRSGMAGAHNGGKHGHAQDFFHDRHSIGKGSPRAQLAGCAWENKRTKKGETSRVAGRLFRGTVRRPPAIPGRCR